ncbi:ABC transporter ATP-binding protein [Pukyongiella litopenaei]|uniref:ABC transporter ATP-binding protein n=1 Tax=Pukyongiella litopenaei TaxID=2605946 RepID=A0A5C2H2F2_9RHOB|nr:ABC transporter ATP-binding protein [Pukyongiella litopenaei]QEP30638.1 ABC transporter ATP-binding protein [Pukyongiella litopenaei]
MSLVEIEDLHVELPVRAGTVHAVRGVSLTVERGETLCIVGESGCGKSTAALAAMGLLPRHARLRAGRFSFQGKDLTHAGRRQLAALRGNRMGMIFQDAMTSLNPSYTVANQLCEVYRRHQGGSRKDAWDRALFLLDRVGMTNAAERMEQYPHQLSGGLRQRVMIAMALMCGPDLLIADEPTSALDVTIQIQILRLLRDLQQEFGMGMLFITHDLGVVAGIADRVAVMYAGEVIEIGSAEDVLRRAAHPYSQGLLHSAPVLGAGRGAPLESIPGVVPSLLERPQGCAFHGRCPHARAECIAAPVAMRRADEGHCARCILIDSPAMETAHAV